MSYLVSGCPAYDERGAARADPHGGEAGMTDSSNNTDSGVPYVRGNCILRDASVQTDESCLAQPSKQAMRMRRYHEARKDREMREMHAHLNAKRVAQQAQKVLQQLQPRQEAVAATVCVRALPVPLITTATCTNAGSEGPMSACLVSTTDGLVIKQLRPVSDLELLECSSCVAQEINKLCGAKRSRTNAAVQDPKKLPSSYVPEYTNPLMDHVWRKQSLMSEDIWSGFPSIFPSTSPLGPHFTFDMDHRGIQRFSFVFPDTLERIEWCAVYVPAEQRKEILQLHNEAALLLADGSLGTKDILATEARYLPVGWASMTCSSRPNRQGGVLPSSPQQVQHDASTSAPGTEIKYRLPYVRIQASAVMPLVKHAAHWMGVAAGALGSKVPPFNPDAPPAENFFDFPPREWQACAESQPHLKGHQLALKLRGLPAECSADVAARLPAAENLDVAAMHADGNDDGLGTIIYLNHKSSAAAADEGMPHADLVVASGRTGGRLVRIQTFSPNHVVCVRMNFCGCMHGNISPGKTFSPVKGISQMRMIHYSRPEIAKLTKLFVDHPEICMLDGDRKDYLLRERSRLGV